MSKTAEQLMAEIKVLKTQNQSLATENATLNEKLQWYEEQIKLGRQKRFGKSSEQYSSNQLNLFNEAEEESTPSLPEPEVEEVVVHRKKKKHHSRDRFENLPVERIVHDIPEEEKVCKICGETMHKMSEEVSRHIEIIPRQYKVVEDVYPIYSCRNCEQNNVETPIVMAEREKTLFPKSFASSSLVAFIMTQKFVNAMPLYRQEQDFKRSDLLLTRQTMANWMIAGANLLKPLYQWMKQEMLKKSVLHADETELEVLQEMDRRAEIKSYMWLYRTSGCDQPIVLYDYEQGRSGKFAQEFLSGFHGYLHTDGWGGYNRLVGEVKLCGCWAHMRRKFDEALKILHNPPTDCPEATGMAYCSRLFHIEKENLSAEERFQKRQEQSTLIVDAFFAWVKLEIAKNPVAKSLLGTALTYAVNQEEKLRRFLEDGRIEISNNRAERSIKPFVIGRKNWLFCNTPKGAKSSAIIYSVIETAKEHGLKPFEYLKWVFDRIHTAQPQELAPWSKNIPDFLKNRKSGDID